MEQAFSLFPKQQTHTLKARATTHNHPVTSIALPLSTPVAATFLSYGCRYIASPPPSPLLCCGTLAEKSIAPGTVAPTSGRIRASVSSTRSVRVDMIAPAAFEEVGDADPATEPATLPATFTPALGVTPYALANRNERGFVFTASMRQQPIAKPPKGNAKSPLSRQSRPFVDPLWTLSRTPCATKQLSSPRATH